MSKRKIKEFVTHVYDIEEVGFFEASATINLRRGKKKSVENHLGNELLENPEPKFDSPFLGNELLQNPEQEFDSPFNLDVVRQEDEKKQWYIDWMYQKHGIDVYENTEEAAEEGEVEAEPAPVCDKKTEEMPIGDSHHQLDIERDVNREDGHREFFDWTEKVRAMAAQGNNDDANEKKQKIKVQKRNYFMLSEDV